MANNRAPTFVRYTDDTVTSVIVSSVRMVDIGEGYSDDDIFNFLAAYLREAVQTDVHRTGNIRGFISVQSEDSGAYHMYDIPINLGVVTGEVMQNMLVNIQDSNQDVLLNELIWTFEVILGPMMAGGKARMPSWWKDRTKWKALWNVPEDVNCLAMSLCYSIRGLDIKGKTYDQRPEQGLKAAKELMKEMKWNKMVTLDAINDFVENPKYDHYEVIVMTTETFLKANQDLIFKGKRFHPKIQIIDGVREETKANRLYLFYDMNQQHMVALRNVQQTYLNMKGSKIAWCHQCHVGWNFLLRTHDHEKGMTKKKAKQKVKECRKCGVWDQAGLHKCPLVTCQNCKNIYAKRGTETFQECHRCILWKDERDPDKCQLLGIGDEPDGSKIGMFAYDFETTLEKIVSPSRKMIRAFKRNDDGRFPISDEFLADVNGLFPYEEGYIPIEEVEYQTDENGKYSWEEGYIGNEIYDTKIHDTTYFIREKHVVNFVYCINWKTKEEKYFYPTSDGIDPLHKFLNWITQYNKGNNILGAHNGSGYDSKFILYHTQKHFLKDHIDVIMRGQKILSLKIGAKTTARCTFIDTLNHLPGPLKKLAGDFCKGENGVDDLMKGYFPHKFNTVENYTYDGKLPSKEMYDILFSAKNVKDVDDFNTWWEEENLKFDGIEVTWNFMDQMKIYNRNDVVLLAMIMEKVDAQSNGFKCC